MTALGFVLAEQLSDGSANVRENKSVATTLFLVFSRLTSMARGIGDPLVAHYARCYLARVGFNLIPSGKEYLLRSLSDCMISPCPYADKLDGRAAQPNDSVVTDNDQRNSDGTSRYRYIDFSAFKNSCEAAIADSYCDHLSHTNTCFSC